jgi:hypothetical protein
MPKSISKLKGKRLSRCSALLACPFCKERHLLGKYEYAKIRNLIKVVKLISRLVETNQNCSPNNHTIAVLAMDTLGSCKAGCKQANERVQRRAVRCDLLK